jgi:hypothetical protein
MGYPARIMAIDGTWFRDCHLEDVSQTGAKISVTGTVQGLNLTEFFLVLSPIGSAHRRCSMIWLKGEEMGLRFEISKAVDSRARRAMRSAEDHEDE